MKNRKLGEPTRSTTWLPQSTVSKIGLASQRSKIRKVANKVLGVRTGFGTDRRQFGDRIPNDKRAAKLKIGSENRVSEASKPGYNFGNCCSFENLKKTQILKGAWESLTAFPQFPK